jgi:Na+/H+ antiporter NhaD/arsenite permease-like protein
VSYHLSPLTLAPFALLLLAIAILPLLAPRFWSSRRNQLVVALACGLPAAIAMSMAAAERGVPWTLHDHPVLASLHEYVSFLVLLFALFTISGGIHVGGTLAGTPTVNSGILATGALLSSVIGTTGASMLLIRPLLRANHVRRRKAHVVVFFLFVVSNCGGMLTPLGDPPLFLGFLHGVPFLWTLGLWKPWLLVNGVLIVLFQFLDSHHFHREDVLDPRRDLDQAVEQVRHPLRVEGGANLLLLAAVVAVVFCSGQFAWPDGLSEGATLILALGSIAATPRAVRAKNHFEWAPIAEVAVLFLGIFLSMTPALKLLNESGAELGVDTPRKLFWASGGLSSFLDNAPTYLTFASVAAGLEGIRDQGRFLADFLALGPRSHAMLAAIACGSVLMGANTYIGNGPNFMVKAIAERAGVRMPSFFGYMAWSCAILLPLFAVVTLLFF